MGGYEGAGGLSHPGGGVRGSYFHLPGFTPLHCGSAPRGLASGRLPRVTQRVPVGPGSGAPSLRTARRALRGMTVTGQTDRLRPDVKLRTDGSGAVGSAGSSVAGAPRARCCERVLFPEPGSPRG